MQIKTSGTQARPERAPNAPRGGAWGQFGTRRLPAQGPATHTSRGVLSARRRAAATLARRRREVKVRVAVPARGVRAAPNGGGSGARDFARALAAPRGRAYPGRGRACCVPGFALVAA